MKLKIISIKAGESQTDNKILTLEGLLRGMFTSDDEGKTGRSLSTLKSQMMESFIKAKILEIRALKGIGNNNITQFQEMFLKNTQDFLNKSFGEECLPIFFDDILSGVNQKELEGMSRPDLIIARVVPSGIELTPIDFKYHPWSERTGESIVKKGQIHISETPLGDELSKKDSPILKLISDQLIAAGLCKTVETPTITFKEGKIIAFDTGDTGDDNPEPKDYCFSDEKSKEFTQEDLLLIKNTELVGILRYYYKDALEIYLKLTSLDIRDIEQLFEEKEGFINKFVETKNNDYFTKKLLRGPIAKLLEIVAIQSSRGKNSLNKGISLDTNVFQFINEVKNTVDQLSEAEKTEVTKNHESLRRFLLNKFIEEGENGGEVITGYSKSKGEIIKEEIQKAKEISGFGGSQIGNGLIGFIGKLIKTTGDLSEEQFRERVNNLLKTMVPSIVKNNKGEPLINKGAEFTKFTKEGLPIEIRRLVFPPAATSSTLGTVEQRENFVKERIPRVLADSIKKALQDGKGVDISLHMHQDSFVKEHWMELGEHPFPVPGDNPGKAEKKSEKNFYWRVDEHGHVFVTVTNIFGMDNLKKVGLMFSELGVQNQVLYDYKLDVKEIARRMIQDVKKQGVDISTVCVGPQASVLGSRMIQSILGFKIFDLFKEKIGNEIDPKSIREIISKKLDDLRDAQLTKIHKKLSKNDPVPNGKSFLVSSIMTKAFSGVDWEGISEILRAPPNKLVFYEGNRESLQNFGFFISILHELKLTKAIGIEKKIDEIYDEHEKRKVKPTDSTDSSESIINMSTVNVPDEDGKNKSVLVVDIAYGDLSGEIADALVAEGGKTVFFCGTAGYDLSNPKEKEKKEKLKLKIGDIIVPTSIRNEKGDFIFGVENIALQTIKNYLDQQEKAYRIVSVVGEGEVLVNSEDPNAVTLILSHHGNVDALLEETTEHMNRLSSKGVKSIEVEVSEIAKKLAGTGVEFIPLLYISDFPGAEGDTFSESGVTNPMSGNAQRAKGIFSGIALELHSLTNKKAQSEKAMYRDLKALFESCIKYLVNKTTNISADDQGKWGSDFVLLMQELRKENAFSFGSLRKIINFLRDTIKAPEIREILKNNERYYLLKFFERAGFENDQKNILREAIENELINGSIGDSILAVRALVSLADQDSLDLLVKNLQDHRLAVRREVFKSMSLISLRLDNQEWISDILVKTLEDKDPLIRWYAAFYLREVDNDQVITTLKNLIDINTKESWYLASAMMTKVKFLKVQSNLAKGFEHENPFVRNLLVAMIGKFGKYEDLSYLTEFLEDPSIAVAESALESIRLIGGKEAQEIISKVSENSSHRLNTEAKNIQKIREIRKSDYEPLSGFEEEVKNRIIGLLLGTAIGDALGLPVEFMSYEQIKSTFGNVENYVTNEERRRQNFKAGMVSDDTQMTVALVQSLVELGVFHLSDITRKFGEISELLDGGKKEDSGYSFSMMQILRMMSLGINWRLSGDKKKDGNGAAMRVLPLGVMFQNDQTGLKVASENQAKATHDSPEAIASSQAISFLVSQLIFMENEFDVKELIENIAGFVDQTSKPFAEKIRQLASLLSLEEQEAIKIIGADSKENGSDAIFSIPAAIYLFLKYPHDFKKAVFAAVNYTGDSDTVASMTGALIGVYNGQKTIPRELINGLDDPETLRKLGQDLFGLVRYKLPKTEVPKVDHIPQKDTPDILPQPNQTFDNQNKGAEVSKETKKLLQSYIKGFYLAEINGATGKRFGSLLKLLIECYSNNMNKDDSEIEKLKVDLMPKLDEYKDIFNSLEFIGQLNEFLKQRK